MARGTLRPHQDSPCWHFFRPAPSPRLTVRWRMNGHMNVRMDTDPKRVLVGGCRHMGPQRKVSPDSVVQWTDPASRGAVLLEEPPLTRATGGLWASPPSLEAPVSALPAALAPALCRGEAGPSGHLGRQPGASTMGQWLGSNSQKWRLKNPAQLEQGGGASAWPLWLCCRRER